MGSLSMSLQLALEVALMQASRQVAVTLLALLMQASVNLH